MRIVLTLCEQWWFLKTVLSTVGTVFNEIVIFDIFQTNFIAKKYIVILFFTLANKYMAKKTIFLRFNWEGTSFCITNLS